MAPETVFRISMPFGYLAWGLLAATYLWPMMRAMERAEALRAIATLHSFRYLGLAFLVPGVVGPGLPGAFAGPAAYGDLLTAVLAVAALLAFRWRWLFLPLAWAFTAVGLGDLLLDTARAVQLGVPGFVGQFGAAYVIPMLYVPLLVVTHVIALMLLVGRRPPGRWAAHRAEPAP